MKAIQFIKDHGVEKANRIVKDAPKNAQRYFMGMYLKQGEWTWWWSSYVNKWLQFEKHIYGDSKFEIAVDLSDLNRLTESVDLVNSFNGLEMAKQFLNENIECSDSERLKQAIADCEEIGGEHV